MDIYDNEILKENSNKIYTKALKEYGVDDKTVLQDDHQRYYYRLVELTKEIDLRNSSLSILDVGCGTGELYKFLNFHGYLGEYLGIDINSDLIASSKKRFPETNFKIIDLFNESQKLNKFDYVLQSGLFNLNFGQNINWVYDFIKIMFQITNQAVIFNAISTYTNFKDDDMFYINPIELFDFCAKNITKRITIMHHNLPYNYTVILYKNDNWNSTIENL